MHMLRNNNSYKCMLKKTNNIPAFRTIPTRYCLIRIHTFSINCLKASTDKVKQPKLEQNYEMNISLENTTIFLGQIRTLVLCQ